MIINGIKNEAVVYAKVIEEAAINQIKSVCDQEFVQGSKIRIMPDVHVGKGCTIGMTMTITDKVVPNIVGVDIGCGMYTINLGKDEIDLDKFDEAVHLLPSGKNVWEGRKKRFDLTGLKAYRYLMDTKRLERSLGTLGGGNHFIEIDQAADGTNYLVIHSGSRNLGKQVAEYYQELAIDLHKGKDEYFQKRDKMILEYKAAGKRKELHEALKTIEWNPKLLELAEDMCFLFGKYVQDYLDDMDICQNFAIVNRETIASFLLDKLKLSYTESFHTIHNYINTSEMILRKGAIAAHNGEKVLIPINMRDGSILAVGKGNDTWNQSAPHGAGRILSRGEAKEKLMIDDYKKEMHGIFSTSINETTLDESPMAYKSIGDIIDVISETVDIIEVLKPIYNFKA